MHVRLVDLLVVVAVPSLGKILLVVEIERQLERDLILQQVARPTRVEAIEERIERAKGGTEILVATIAGVRGVRTVAGRLVGHPIVLAAARFERETN